MSLDYRHATRSIGCPIPWCDGLASQHGDEGDGPELWLHGDGGREVGLDAHVYRYQEGAAASTYGLVMGTAVVVEDAPSLADLAATLRDMANAIEALGSE